MKRFVLKSNGKYLFFGEKIAEVDKPQDATLVLSFDIAVNAKRRLEQQSYKNLSIERIEFCV